MLVTRLITSYILWSIRLRIPPWWYFQINAEYFNAIKGYYSKLEIDAFIPEKWRLKQTYLTSEMPEKFPIFIKPEWGQNSNGIIKINSLIEFKQQKFKPNKVPLLVQEMALGKREFEIFYIQNYNDHKDCITLKITETLNKEIYPINSIDNKNTSYQDITSVFLDKELIILKNILQQLPCFRIARICMRADSKQDLLNEKFKIIEINLFAPMPLHLLDKKISKATTNHFIKTNMFNLVKVSANIPKKYFTKNVFFKTILRHYQVK